MFRYQALLWASVRYLPVGKLALVCHLPSLVLLLECLYSLQPQEGGLRSLVAEVRRES